MVTRRVVLVCGPPGSGKTTHARSLGLEVYDIDDQHWDGDGRRFNAALERLGKTPDAQAAVIRSGASRSARGKAATLIGATETVVLAVDAATCIQRVRDRQGSRQLVHKEIAGIRAWWERYETDELGEIGATSEAW